MPIEPVGETITVSAGETKYLRPPFGKFWLITFGSVYLKGWDARVDIYLEKEISPGITIDIPIFSMEHPSPKPGAPEPEKIGDIPSKFFLSNSIYFKIVANPYVVACNVAGIGIEVQNAIGDIKEIAVGSVWNILAPLDKKLLIVPIVATGSAQVQFSSDGVNALIWRFGVAGGVIRDKILYKSPDYIWITPIVGTIRAGFTGIEVV